ncbi:MULTISPECIES: glycine betaine ABC transporter substrate-binding protein [unclassified Janthinobacterium]|uniref:glycine betaine ABC transporter substrate-binding protein n=1 Tax=unclassified Janthinobacterium TaxID=2610881 RepID=UPI00160840F1|nr:MULTISPECIES: glycine betaine ABC transporter substrate-binding protein [unclassified Janthinobacterium]MBB5368072.1 osmoprotectant transport system permease protein [Janthinobacterium sp. K2C7]MBB5379450.1 osmoprotectant transport system permease protein [Janthinobacterium sp. K2Li3]MBB5386454.1 osmoprotectant transport system permease protein [Janthinobacterium sp. K2E3]
MDGGTLKVGSKRFTESYILGEIVRQSAAPHVRTEHRQGLGNTAIVLAALQAGSIDVYAEYMGTIASEILKHDKPITLDQMQRELAPLGLGVAVPLGFNNTYALAMRSDADISRLDQLAAQPALKFGLSHEFIGRVDGWPGLAARYGLPQRPRGLDHGIAYEALAQRQVDVIDIYSTDAKIRQYGLRVLADTQQYFPRYDAMLLYRLDLPPRFPTAWKALQTLQGRISESDMIAMNAAVEIDGRRFADVAQQWLMQHEKAGGQANKPVQRTTLLDKILGDDLWTLTRQHLTLVLLSVGVACLIGIPLGVLAAFYAPLRQTVLALVGVLQTVPSLALLAILIPVLGMIGTVPALVALCVYALLPIVRNTCTGILQVPEGLRMAALALGLSKRDRLLYVDLPLALPVILAGVKTAAVMSVGTATIAAFIGAGGYGERITIGLALNDNDMLLAGAIPAAVLALLTQGLFELVERWAVAGRQR